MPKILFIAMPESVHTARWMAQIADQGWELHLFPVYRTSPHPALRDLTLYGGDPWRPGGLDRSVHYKRRTFLYFYLDYFSNKLFHRPSQYKETALANIIRKLKPDLVHSLEFQHAGYMTLEAKQRLKAPFPKWIATNWGSDIYLFGRLAEHKPRIQEVLANCDYYSAECERDVRLAQEHGFSGKVLPVLPNTGGYDLEGLVALRQAGPTSSRKVIALKGYQHWAGRALVGLNALRLCQDVLAGYEIVIYVASEETKIAAELFSQETGIPVTMLPKTSHEEILRLHGRSRISIGLSISDAISTSLLEAMAMGSFPIQSGTACADEWIMDGAGGSIVPPEDPVAIASAIRNALSDDVLVDSAAELNAVTVNNRLNQGIIKGQVVEIYQSILNETLKGK